MEDSEHNHQTRGIGQPAQPDRPQPTTFSVKREETSKAKNTRLHLFLHQLLLKRKGKLTLPSFVQVSRLRTLQLPTPFYLSLTSSSPIALIGDLMPSEPLEMRGGKVLNDRQAV